MGNVLIPSVFSTYLQLILGGERVDVTWALTPWNIQTLLYVLWWGHDYCQHHPRYPAPADQSEYKPINQSTNELTSCLKHKVAGLTWKDSLNQNDCLHFVLIISGVQHIDLCLQDKRAAGFQRSYHVTDPFIKRLGLEAELQVGVDMGVLVCVDEDGKSCEKWERERERSIFLCIVISHSFYCLSPQGHTGCVNCLEWNERGE